MERLMDEAKREIFQAVFDAGVAASLRVLHNSWKVYDDMERRAFEDWYQKKVNVDTKKEMGSRASVKELRAVKAASVSESRAYAAKITVEVEIREIEEAWKAGRLSA